MTEIDLTTGLPALPEDHYWRLEKYGVSIRKHLSDTPWQRVRDFHWGFGFSDIHTFKNGYKVETKTVSEEVQIQKELSNFWPWNKKRYETVTEVQEVIYERHVKRTKEVVSVPTAYTGETEIIYGNTRYLGTRYPSYGYYGVPEYDRTPDKVVKLREVLTRDNVLELCEKALKQLDGLTLQGEYPPKKFDRD